MTAPDVAAAAAAPVLLHVADAAFPFDLALLPRDCHTVAGYAGGDTPHAWTAADVHGVRSHGLSWWAIWTAPNSPVRPLTAAEGDTAGRGMALRLHELNYPSRNPVFLDIERAVYDASPAGASACATAWRSRMHGDGFFSAHVYCARPLGDWWPNWTGTRPTSLPAGVVGEQYASDKMLGKPFDLSVFDPSTVRALTPPPAAPAAHPIAALLAADSAGVMWAIDAALTARRRVPAGRGDRRALIGSGVYTRVALSDELLRSIPIR